MESARCPVCSSESLHSFWYWENEEFLMREWAPDCRLHVSICRECATAFQNPAVEKVDDMMDFSVSFDMDEAAPAPSAKEPIDWLHQFSGVGRDPLRGLDVYVESPMFEIPLRDLGWDVASISLNDLLEQGPPAGGQYDVVFCFDALNHTLQPQRVIEQLRPVVKDSGGLFVETNNLLAEPRRNIPAFTSKQKCLYSFPSLIYLLYKNGFRNYMAENAGRTRCFLNKVDMPDNADVRETSDKEYWAYVVYRCERNFWYQWAGRQLESFMQRRQSDPAALDAIRQEMRHDPHKLTLVREVCGAMLLFAQEVDTIRQTLSSDWHSTMSRVFDILKNDMILYELLQLEPMQGMGTLEPIGRLHLNEKMVYMTDAEYFQKYFTEDDARQLCENVIKSSQTVIGHLSSFL